MQSPKTTLMLVLFGSIMFSCNKSKQEVEPKSPPEIQSVITTTPSCSYPFQGQEITVTNTSTLSPGKYYKKISRGQYMADQYKFSVRRISGNGRVIVRSVLEDKRYIWQAPIYQLADGCYNLNSNGDAITLGPKNINNPWDNLYYEIIVEGGNSTINWSLYY